MKIKKFKKYAVIIVLIKETIINKQILIWFNTNALISVFRSIFKLKRKLINKL